MCLNRFGISTISFAYFAIAVRQGEHALDYIYLLYQENMEWVPKPRSVNPAFSNQ